MATDAKDIELRVRARDYSRKTLDGVTSALEDMTKAQDEQLASAKKGQTSANALEASYKKIESAVNALIKQSNLTKVFESQAAALEEVKQKADAARKAQLDYETSIASITEKTKAQVAQQAKLATAVSRADKAQLNAQNRLDATVAKLAEYGIATDQLATAQKRMVDGVNQGNAALERQQAAIDTVEADMRAAAESAAAKATADKKAAADQAAAEKQVAAALALSASRRAKMLEISNSVEKAKFNEAQAETAVVAAMRKSADQAEAAAKGYSVLARSVASVRTDELGKQLSLIANPVAEANKNLEGLGENLSKLVSKVNAINGPVKDFRATMAALNAAMQATQGIGAQISAYRAQIDVLRAARTEYSAAQAAVRNLTTAMRAGGGDAGELSKQLTSAQNALKGAAAAISTQVSKTREMRTALQEAGVDTKNLDAAETQLVAHANQAAAAMQKLNDAYKKNGAAADDAAKKTFKFFDNTRQSLSYTQRLRGELLALATAYVGIQGAIDLAKQSIEAFSTVQKIQSQLLIANGGDATKAADDFAYLRATADRIGISFKEAAPAFGKFAIAAKTFGLSGQETRFVFEKLAESSRKAGLSASDFEGVLKAVEQMLSKGTIQAEELRGQLGDRLPGAFQAMASGVGKTTAELSKMMEVGGLGAGEVLNLARGLDKAYAGATTATMELNGAQARFANAAFDFQKQIADAGLAQAFTELLNKLTSFMKSGEGQLLAQQIGQAFTALVDVLKLAIDHVDDLKTVFSLLLGLAAAKWAYAAAAGFISLVTAVGSLVTTIRGMMVVVAAGEGVLAALGGASVATAGGVGILRGALLLLTRTVPLLAALTAGIMLAKFAYDKLKVSKDRALDSKSTTKMTGNGAEGDWTTDPNAPTPDPGTGPDAGIRKAKEIQDELAKNQKKLDKETIAARKKAAKDELGERADIIKEKYAQQRDAAKTQVTDAKTQADLISAIDKQEKQDLLNDQIRYNAENAKSNEAAANKEVSLKQQVADGLKKIEDDLAKQETKLDQNASFEERKKTRVEAIAHAYDKLKTTITKLSALDKEGAADAMKKLDGYVGQLQAVEEQKATLDEVKRLEKELDDQQKLRTASLDQQKIAYDAGLISQQEFLSNTTEINTRSDTAVKKAADDLQSFVDAAVKAKAGILSLTDQAEIKVKTTTAVASSSSSVDKNAQLAIDTEMKGLDALVAKRDQANALYQQQFELRMIDQDEYAKRVNANNELYKAKIIEETTLILQQMEARKAQGILEGTLTTEKVAAIDAQIAKITLLQTATANAVDQATLFGTELQKGLSGGIDTSLNAVVDSLTQIAEGTQTAAQGFQNLGITVVNFVAQFLVEIAKAIAKQLILNAIAGSGGALGAAAKAAGGVVAGVKHDGGKVTKGGNSRSRSVDPGWFTNAPRFHEGGLPGLKSDEVPAILQTGEQVLARDDPNNVLNGQRPINMENAPGNRFVLVDDRSGVPEAMASAEGDKVIMVALKRNASTVKQIAR